MFAARALRGPARTAARAAAAPKSKLSATLAPAARLHRLAAATPVPILTRSLHTQPAHRAQAAEAAALPADQAAVARSADGNTVVVTWADGRKSTFDNHFLFDHCRCASCFHSGTKQRLKTLGQIPANVEPASVELNGAEVRITWATTPAHESVFPLSFLHQASYDPPLAARTDLLHQTPQRRWGASIAQNPPTVTYESVMPATAGADADAGVLAWLDRVHEYGFCFVSGVPATPEATEELIRRMNFIRETHYGGFWDFTADMSKGDLAYSNQSLPAHTDTAYFTDPAGLQIFHCLHHPSPPGTGGETLLVDGFYAAEQLQQRNPDAYATLSRLAVPFHASGNEGTLLRPPISQPVLRHDHQGRLMQVRWNNEDRCVLGEGWTPAEVREWYDAARQYEDIVTAPETEYWVKLVPGNVVVIDNWRVMHGRAGFTGERRMCGAYVGADDWRSKRAALHKKLKGTNDPWHAGW